jgi:hypothetical protein
VRLLWVVVLLPLLLVRLLWVVGMLLLRMMRMLLMFLPYKVPRETIGAYPQLKEPGYSQLIFI